MTVIVARADDKFSQELREAGLEVIDLELIRTAVLADLSDFETVVLRIDEYDGVFFTSPVAAAVFTAHVQPPVRPKLYVLGRRAMSVLENRGFETEGVPGANTAEELLTSFGTEKFRGKKLLFIRGEKSMRTIPEKLTGVASVDEIAVYRTIEIEPAEETVASIGHEISSGEVKWICFFSPSGVEAFEKRFGAVDVQVATIGDTTAARARELGFEVGLVASTAANSIFAQELISHAANI